MTREEAIEWMDWLKLDIKQRGYNDIVTALNMAIKALEQDPCEIPYQSTSGLLNAITYQEATNLELCEDCVSREEVLKVFSYNHDYCDDYEKAFLKSIGDTRKLPPVQPASIHAKWIGIEYDGYADGNPVYEVWECSHCGCEHCGDYDTLTAYCPNCGADMREVEE